MGDIGEVDVLHVELVAVELEIVVAHALHLALEPLARNHPHPIEGVAEVDDIARTDAGGFLLLDPGHARLHGIDGRVCIRRLGRNATRCSNDGGDRLRARGFRRRLFGGRRFGGGRFGGGRFRRRLLGSRILGVNVEQRDGQQGGPHDTATEVARLSLHW